jgi:hypothetical protein
MNLQESLRVAYKKYRKIEWTGNCTWSCNVCKESWISDKIPYDHDCYQEYIKLLDSAV